VLTPRAVTQFKRTSFAVLGLEGEVLVHHTHAAQAAVRSLDVPAAQHDMSRCMPASQLAADLLQDLITDHNKSAA
jgi:hypothetical protein